jgi:flavodoxin
MRKRTTLNRRESLASALSIGLCAGLASVVDGAQAQQVGGRSRLLVAYFSRSGNTRLVAGHVRRALGADLFEIQPAQPYPEDYEATVRQAERERDTGFEPALKETVADIGPYETIFLGFPIWGTTTPPVIRSFLSRHDLAGKSIVPLVTHGGYGTGQSRSVVARLAPKARLREGFTLQMDQEREILRRITGWLGTVNVRG